MKSWERLAALFAAAVAIAFNVAASVLLFTPPSTFGYDLIYTDGNRVATVDPGTAAARAGIRVGNHLDFSRSSLSDRIVGLAYQPPVAGDRTTFNVESRTVTLTATPLTAEESRHATFSPVTPFLRLTGFAYIAVALVILLRRPNRMTWGLFLYLLSATDVTLFRFSYWLFPVAQFAGDILAVAGPIGLVIFAARFPDDHPAGWRVWLDRLAIPIGALFMIPNLTWDAVSLYGSGSPEAWMSLGSVAGALALMVVAGVTLVVAYFGVERGERQRFVWVMAGVMFTLVSYAANWAHYWSTTYTLVTSDALVWLAVVLYAIAPFAIAYAVVRQRVFDISFVISRALVYTILTGCIFATFAFVEWLAARFIEQSGVTIVFVALTAIVIAFSLEAAHARIETLVEGLLFRRRHLAERHLASVAAGLPFAENGGIVDEALLHEPLEAYALTTSALFKRDDAGDYRSEERPLDAAVSLKLLGTRHSVRLNNGDAALAVPVFVRSRLEAVALYGPHANGEDLDPDEVASLEAMCTAAGTAYDHLDALRITRETARWRRLAERQARELATLRERTALLGEHLAGDDAHGNGPM